MRYTITAFVAAAIAGVNAYTQPKGDQPIGNPFKTPELNTQVPKGKPYEVTWEPTIDKAGTVTILLLHGPSSNAVAQYPIAEKIPNTGSFTWTPSADIDPENTHYGLQLIVDATGQYQYTPQFGISGKKSEGETSSKPAPTASESKGDSYPTARPEEPSKATSVPEGYPTAPLPSGTNVPPQPSASKTGPVYLTTTQQVTTCSYPTVGSGTAPVASGTGAPVPPVGSGAPGAPGAPVGTAPVVPGAPAPSGTVPGSAGQSGIATGAAGKTMVASGAAIVVALFALAL